MDVACKTCPLNTLIEGASECCQPGTYQNNDQCFACPQPQYCVGGTTCNGNREGLACMKCKANYYTVDGDTCIQCPESSIGQWSIAIGVILVCIFVVYKILEEKKNLSNDEEEQDNKNTKNKKSKKVTRQKSIESFRNGLEKSMKRSNRIQSTFQTGFSILAKHTLYFSFTIPLIPLIHLPTEIRQMLQSFLSLFIFDLSNFVSSPECEWKAPTVIKYIIKMILPLLFVTLFFIWYKIGVKYAVDSRNLKNKIIGVAMFLWITTLYSLNAYQTLSAFDCTRPRTPTSDSLTLDMDPEITCYNNENHTIIIIFSIMSLTLYTTEPILISISQDVSIISVTEITDKVKLLYIYIYIYIYVN